MLLEECADGARRSTEGDEDNGKTDDEGKRLGKQAAARWLTLAQLLHADTGEHGDVARDKWEYAGR